jgi:hypothetical protein
MKSHSASRARQRLAAKYAASQTPDPAVWTPVSQTSNITSMNQALYSRKCDGDSVEEAVAAEFDRMSEKKAKTLAEMDRLTASKAVAAEIDRITASKVRAAESDDLMLDAMTKAGFTLKPIPASVPSMSKHAPSPPVEASPSSPHRPVVLTTIQGGTPDERANVAINMIRDRAKRDGVKGQAMMSLNEEDDETTRVTWNVTGTVGDKGNRDDGNNNNTATSRTTESPADSPETARLCQIITRDMASGQGRDAEADWMRGFCAIQFHSMRTCLFGIKECLAYACMALGKPSWSTGSRRTRAADVSVTLGAAVCAANMGTDAGMRIAHEGIMTLTSADCLALEGEARWRLCEVLLAVDVLCEAPCRIAPLATQWLRHTATDGKRIDHMGVAIKFAHFMHRRGHPWAAARLIGHTIHLSGEHRLLSPSGAARLYMLRGTFLTDADRDEEAVEAYQTALGILAIGTSLKPDQPSHMSVSLLLDLHMRAAGVYQSMDRADKSMEHIEKAHEILEFDASPFDLAPAEMRVYEALVMGSMIATLAHLKCFRVALSKLSSFSDDHRQLIRMDGKNVEEFELYLNDCARRNHDEVDTDCDWRRCMCCKRVAKGMEHCPCTTVWYCGEECQTKDWPRHRSECARCWNCEKVGFDFKWCTCCWLVRYCSEKCSIEHWPVHKEHCAPSFSEADSDASSNTTATASEHEEMHCELLNPFEHMDIVQDMLGATLEDCVTDLVDYAFTDPDRLD